MKSKILMLLLSALPILGIAQKANLTKADSLHKAGNLPLAVKYIEEALLHEETKEDQKTIYTSGKIYESVALSSESKTISLKEDPFKLAISQYRKITENEKSASSYKLFANKRLSAIIKSLSETALKTYNEGDFTSAAYYFDIVSHANPKDTSAALNAMLSYSNVNNTSKTKEFANKLIELDFRKPVVYQKLVYAAEKEGNIEEAIIYSKQGTTLFPKNLSLLSSEIELLRKNGKTKEATQALEQVVVIDPTNAKWFFTLGVLYEELDSFSLAEEKYKEALTHDSQNHKYILNLASLYYNTGAKKIQKYNKLSHKKQRSKEGKAILEEARKLLDSSIPFFKESLTLKEDRQAYIGLKYAYDHTGRSKEAKQIEQELEQLD